MEIKAHEPGKGTAAAAARVRAAVQGWRLWPRNLAGRAMLLLLVSLMAFHLGSLWLHQRDAQGAHAIASTSFMAVGIIAVSLLLVRWLTGPLCRLVHAADRIGRGPRVDVPQGGPEEARCPARALDAMQARNERLVHDRTQALAAVSHDLRTPITCLRFRAGFLGDPEMQVTIDADLREMEAMINATLAYLQGGVGAEAVRLTDVGAMLFTLRNAAVDAGGSVALNGPSHLNAICRLVALRRALANLIGNAIAYGGPAAVHLTRAPSSLRIVIEDGGPGIPEAELERVFEPFHRPEASRNRGTGGVGLGLTIARQAIAEQGGTLALSNRAEGGLRATITLPGTPLAARSPDEPTDPRTASGLIGDAIGSKP